MSLLLIIIATSLVRVSRKRYLSLQCWLESGIVAGEQAGQPSLGQGALRKCEAQLLLLIAHPPRNPFISSAPDLPIDMDTLHLTCCWVAVDELFQLVLASYFRIPMPTFTHGHLRDRCSPASRRPGRTRPCDKCRRTIYTTCLLRALTFRVLLGVLQHVELRSALLPFARRVFNFGSAGGD